MKISIERVLTDEATQALYPTYALAFKPLLTEAAARHMLSAEEFAKEMNDPRIEKYLVRDDHDQAIGLTTLTTDLSVIDWINEHFYASRYPEAVARNALFYLGYTLVDPDHRRSNALLLMASEVNRRVAGCRGVVAFDICRHNVTHGVGRLTARIFSPSDRIDTLDTQTYYAADYQHLLQAGADQVRAPLRGVGPGSAHSGRPRSPSVPISPTRSARCSRPGGRRSCWPASPVTTCRPGGSAAGQPGPPGDGAGRAGPGPGSGLVASDPLGRHRGRPAAAAGTTPSTLGRPAAGRGAPNASLRAVDHHRRRRPARQRLAVKRGGRLEGGRLVTPVGTPCWRRSGPFSSPVTPWSTMAELRGLAYAGRPGVRPVDPAAPALRGPAAPVVCPSRWPSRVGSRSGSVGSTTRCRAAVSS